MLSVESRYQQVGKTEGPWEFSTEQQQFSKLETSAFIVFCHRIVNDSDSHRNSLDFLKFCVQSL
jgi:hypothetical protein